MQIPSQTLVQARPLDSVEARIARGLIKSSQVEDRFVEQLQTDITAFPTAWLKRFQKEQLSVAVLKDNQTLADTPVLAPLTEAEIDEIVAQGRPMVHQAVKEVMGPLQDDYAKYCAAGDLKSRLFELANQGLGFDVMVSRDAKDLTYLAETFGFDPQHDPESFARWKQAFLDLNGELVERQGESVKPVDGVYAVPYVMYRGKPVRAISLPNFQTLKGMDFAQHLGANYPENRLVILHESVLANPSQSAGKHRVALHELGHAIDWICRELPETKDTHEQKVEELYQLARQRETQGQSPFLTPRARDSSGEMMAEAVEAYLTLQEPDFYKPENHRENLRKNFPELYSYVDYLIQL